MYRKNVFVGCGWKKDLVLSNWLSVFLLVVVVCIVFYRLVLWFKDFKKSFVFFGLECLKVN